MFPNAILHIKRNFPKRKFLIIGKGPSFQNLDSIDCSDYVTIGLNHVCEETKVDYAHIIDIEVIDHIGDKIEQNCDFLIMPIVPHERSKFKLNNKVIFWPSAMTLFEWVENSPLLKRLNEQGRLLSYDLSSVEHLVYQAALRVKVRTFSASTVVSLLSSCNISNVNLLGVDGGNQYGSSFDKYSKTTKLQTGQQNFNIQFKEIADSKHLHKMDISHLGWRKTNIIIKNSDGLSTFLQKQMITRMCSLTVSFNSHPLEGCFNISINGAFLPIEDLSLYSSGVSESIHINSGPTVYDYMNSYSLTDYFHVQSWLLNWLIKDDKAHLLDSRIASRLIRKSILLQLRNNKVCHLSEISVREAYKNFSMENLSLYIKLMIDKILLYFIRNNRFIFDVLINKNYSYFTLLVIYSAIRKRLIKYGTL